MKEITRIHLAKMPFSVEVDAKKSLDKYLSSIQKNMNAESEAMREIEARMVELLEERGVTGERVVTAEDVDALKQQLGDPTSFIDEDKVADDEQGPTVPMRERKLFRDTNNQIIGGVCSGLAAYVNIDTVWVRLGFIVLTIVSFGAMILLYIAMWLITPPARTAAERVQMKGVPVTLEAIKAESANTAVYQSHRDKAVLAVLRVIGGMLAISAAVLATVGMIVAGYQILLYSGVLNLYEKISIGAIFFAGICFVVFCLMVLRLIFAGRVTKRSWAKLGIIVAVGLSTFIAGVTGYGMSFRLFGNYEKSTATTKQDASLVKGVTDLTVNGKNTNLNYVVAPGEPRAELKYNTSLTKGVPRVQITRNGNNLNVNVSAEKSEMCFGYCPEQTTLTVYGPELHSLTAESGSLAYRTLGQKALNITAKDQSEVLLEGSQVIEDLVAKAESAFVRTSEANVKNVELTADNQSRVSLGKIGRLNLTAPTTCANSGKLDVSVVAAQTILINGAEWKGESQNTPCMNFVRKSSDN